MMRPLEEIVTMAREVFHGTSISVTEEGKHLGAALGPQAFIEKYVKRTVSELINAVERLSSIAHTQPHLAYATFTHDLMSYLTRCVLNTGELLSPLEDSIRYKFLPSLTDENAFNNATQELMALLIRLSGLGIVNPTSDASSNYDTSMKNTASLTALIMEQSRQYSCTTRAEQLQIKKEVVKAKEHH